MVNAVLQAWWCVIKEEEHSPSPIAVAVLHKNHAGTSGFFPAFRLHGGQLDAFNGASVIDLNRASWSTTKWKHVSVHASSW